MPDSGFSDLSSALSKLLDRVGEGQPLKLSVSVSDADEVAAFKAEIYDLHQQLATLDASLKRAEFTARCNSIICMRVVDWCRENRIQIPRSLYKGLDEF